MIGVFPASERVRAYWTHLAFGEYIGIGMKSGFPICQTAGGCGLAGCAGAIQALVTGMTVVNRTIAPILELVDAKAVFYGISIAGVAELSGL